MRSDIFDTFACGDKRIITIYSFRRTRSRIAPKQCNGETIILLYSSFCTLSIIRRLYRKLKTVCIITSKLCAVTWAYLTDDRSAIGGGGERGGKVILVEFREKNEKKKNECASFDCAITENGTERYREANEPFNTIYLPHWFVFNVVSISRFVTRESDSR